MESRAQFTTREIDIRKFDAPIGAEILDVDLDEVDDDLFRSINDALLKHQVLVFRDQSFSEAGQLAISNRWGQIRSHVMKRGTPSERPELLVLTNLDAQGKPKGTHPDPGSAPWHTDGSWTTRPSIISMLYALEIPPTGGDTLFADMYGAYESLALEMKTRIAHLKAFHDLDYARILGGAREHLSDEQLKAAPAVEHPIVQKHPETGRPVIYLGEYGRDILGLQEDEGRALIRDINSHATQDQFVFRHRWRHHDVVVWDNRCTLHRVTDFDFANDRRIMRRSTVTSP